MLNVAFPNQDRKVCEFCGDPLTQDDKAHPSRCDECNMVEQRSTGEVRARKDRPMLNEEQLARCMLNAESRQLQEENFFALRESITLQCQILTEKWGSGPITIEDEPSYDVGVLNGIEIALGLLESRTLTWIKDGHH